MLLMSVFSFRASSGVARILLRMSEIDLTLALQLQAQFEEELRVSRLKQQEEQQHKTEDVPFVLGNGRKLQFQ